MEPIPETQEALRQITIDDAGDLEARLREIGRVARSIVPELVGLSLGLVRDGLTFTLVASDAGAARIDAAQYLDGGPCLRGEGEDATIQIDIDDLLDDDTWELFARASRAVGVASSLSLPVRRGDEVIGGINLYAGSPGAFAGQQAVLASALGATAEGAMADADLAFASRARAEDAPRLLRDQHDVDVAVGLLTARYQERPEAAAHRLASAADRAGLAPAVVARVLLYVQGGPTS